jgi:hypothetical protein
MSPDMKQFELDRITTMLKAFGWQVVGSRFEGDKVHVDFEMIVPKTSTITKEGELSRLQNMLKSFSWVALSSKYDGDKVHAEFEKIIAPVSP